MLDQVFFSLDADRFKQFTAMLDAAPGPDPGLERLMAVKAPLEHWRGAVGRARFRGIKVKWREVGCFVPL